MIITCNNCNKKFKVDSSLIPASGREIRCGSCNYTWFFTPEMINKEDVQEPIKVENILNQVKDEKKSDPYIDIIKTKKNKPFKFSNILSYLLIIIISFIGLIIVLDTFKVALESIFPNLELLLFNLFESLNDIFLFIKNLLI